MDYLQKWLTNNEADITRRLQWVRQQPNGDIYAKTSNYHDIIVHKAGSQIQLIFRDPTATDVMSRLDLNDALRLVAAYTQALILGLIWMPQPRLVYVAGLGGGRLPIVLHHYFPEIQIDCTELDPTVVELAQRFFGVRTDERLRVIVGDSREYLEKLKESAEYDLIILDAFRGTGYGPYRLATSEFYQLCRRKLSSQGVVLANLLDIDPLYQAKIFTFTQSFEQTFLCFYQDATVLVGTIQPAPVLEPFEIVAQAQILQELHQFRFPLVQVAHKVLGAGEVAEYLSEIVSQPLLGDKKLPSGYLEGLDTNSSIFTKTRRDEACPCASGKKYRHCHGRSH